MATITYNDPGGSGGADADAIHDNVTGEIHVVTAKTTPVAADEFLIEDSAASWAKKRVTLANMRAGPTFTGQSLFASGSVSAPGVGFSSSTSSGLYYELVLGILPTVFLTVNGTSRMSIGVGVPAVHAGSGSEATAADGTGEVQIGASGAQNIGMDGNEIQSRSGSAGTALEINPHGGQLKVNGIARGHLAPDSMADDSWEGPTATLTAAESLTIGQVCYINSSSKMAKGDADATATSGVMCIALASISADATGLFGLPGGYLRDDSQFAWTPGATLYLDTTAGGMTATAPSGVGDIVQVVGYAHEADIVFFNPSPVLIEVGA